MFENHAVVHYRRVLGQCYELSARKKKVLLGAATGEVFSKGFIEQFPKISAGLTPRDVDRNLANLRTACARKATFQDVVVVGYRDWFGAYRMGPKAMAFLLDIVTAFGFEMEGAPEAKLSKTKPRTGAELAEMLKK